MEMKMVYFENTQNNSEMVIYTTADGLAKIETTFIGAKNRQKGKLTVRTRLR